MEPALRANTEANQLWNSWWTVRNVWNEAVTVNWKALSRYFPVKS